MFQTIKRRWVLAIFLVSLLLFGCSGKTPVAPDSEGDNTAPREVLSAFADACVQGDIDTACEYLINPDRWRGSMEKAEEALPYYGACLGNAEETNRERDCYRYRVRMSHPDDPRHRIIESKVYVRRIRDLNGRTSHWGVDFINPGDGQQMPGRDRDRTTQWGTLDTHATLLTLSIITYYINTYPDDTRFTGPNGLLHKNNCNIDTLIQHPGPIETILGFDYDNYENMPPDVNLASNAFRALIQAGSVDEDVFNGEYNQDGSVNFSREIHLIWDNGLRYETTIDFGDDDDTFLKGFAHFLTPVTQSPWQTQYSEFDDAELLGGTDGAAVSSVDWALGTGTLGPYNILGLLDLRASRNRKSFPEAIDLMQPQVSHDDTHAVFDNFANSFYTFGYVLHLLEDAGIPAHCRNDMHGVPYISSIPGFGDLQPDPMEEWAESLAPSFVAETTSILGTLIAENDPITRDDTGFPENSFLQHLYDNAEHTDYAGTEALFEYTAFVSNRMCFSEDTIYRSTKPSAARTADFPYLTDLDLEFFGKSVVYGSPGSFISNDEYIAGVGNAMFDVWRSWFWTTHWFSDPDVDDVIEALEDDWDILTVADDDDDDYFANSVLGVREQQWRLLFPHITRTGAALLHEFYLEVYDDSD